MPIHTIVLSGLGGLCSDIMAILLHPLERLLVLKWSCFGLCAKAGYNVGRIGVRGRKRRGQIAELIVDENAKGPSIQPTWMLKLSGCFS
jgi:hypothetical protein